MPGVSMLLDVRVELACLRGPTPNMLYRWSTGFGGR